MRPERTEVTRREEWRWLRKYHHDGHMLPWRSCWLDNRPRLTQWCWRCVWRELTGQRRRAKKAWIADMRRRRDETPLHPPIDLRPYIGRMDEFVAECRRTTEGKP